jgi:putative sterol carrier protein
MSVAAVAPTRAQERAKSPSKTRRQANLGPAEDRVRMARSDQDDDETYYFPNQAWFEEYCDRINADDEYADAAAEWGTDFDGDFVFEMEDMAVEHLDTDTMADSLAEDLDRYVPAEGDSHAGYAHLGLEAGECTAARLVERPDRVDAGFTLSTDADSWKRLLRGELGVIDGLMTGRCDIDSDMQKVLQYSRAAVRQTETAAGIDAMFAGEVYADP